MDLPIKEQRIEHLARIIAGNVANEFNLTGLGVHFNNGNVSTEWKCRALRGVVGFLH